jgi:outer membrane murein-binding lipoprotein Lpp
MIDSNADPAQRVTMSRPILLAALVCLSPALMAADDLKVSQLEQDVRELQRQVQALSRELDSLRLALPAAAQGGSPPRDVGRAGVAPAWVDAAKWQRIRPGMSELEVIAILGSPTSMRTEEGARVLLYALEIGASGFLVGSVRLRERSVESVQNPTLR